MSKFMNVVRSKVKEGKKDEYMKKLKEFFNNMKGTDGLISMKQIQTGLIICVSLESGKTSNQSQKQEIK